MEMKSAFIETAEDIQWLMETHLRGVVLPSAYHGFKFAVLQGNEDSPFALNLYKSDSPNFDDDYLRVTFDHEAPIYCEYIEFDGKTDQPKRMACHRA